ncbi:DDE_3 domain-containing protein [Trichonephila clavipes]|nr:DDE_3 domain-containing protein [Trichonephila clavipes]
MDDNARPHRARIVKEYLEDHGLERMEWPARSPDLNLIEHLWDYLGREVAALNPPPRSLHELKQGLLCVWSSLSIPVSDNLINSMGNRCRQCIQYTQKSQKIVYPEIPENSISRNPRRQYIQKSQKTAYPEIPEDSISRNTRRQYIQKSQKTVYSEIPEDSISRNPRRQYIQKSQKTVYPEITGDSISRNQRKQHIQKSQKTVYPDFWGY